ncbi:MAG: DUF4091 domain-containing protein, partial [Candidatus Hydrogenedentes bacterium]|nr:DUF4091 domain-containing protein [Candidatus Hydrogenedentota bacterium]
ELYAFPYQAYDPLLIQRMKNGISLEQTPPNPATLRASGADSMASAIDAYDGSLHTAWESAQSPSERNPAWIQLDFQEPIELAEFAIVWETGHETRDIIVTTAYPGNPPGTATVEWDHQIVQGDFVQNRSTGVMKFVKKTNLLRLEFRSPSPKGPIGITEIVIGAGEYSELDDVSGLVPWLDINQGAFPAPIAGSPPVVARTASWLCWTTGFAGIYGGGLNAWPRSWNINSAAFAFDTAEESLHALVYPLGDALAPSIRLARLRDGLEDYEYLAALRAASRNTVPEDPALAGLLKPQVFQTAPRTEDLAALADRIEEIRIRIGRWLTELEDPR